jgi:hypothetical protein
MIYLIPEYFGDTYDEETKENYDVLKLFTFMAFVKYLLT